MNTEDIVREIINKICPYHATHPTVQIPEIGQMDISACCEEFLTQIENIVNVEIQSPFDTAASSEIM